MDMFDSVNNKSGFHLLKYSCSQCPEKQLLSTPQNQSVFRHWTVILICSKINEKKEKACYLAVKSGMLSCVVVRSVG